MPIAYFDCLSGISGDMTLAALIDAGADAKAIEATLQSLGLPDIRLVVEATQRRGFRARQIRIEHPPEHAHRHLHHIEAMLDKATLSARADATARKIFAALAEAEAAVHGTTVEKVHFHEVGAIDSIGDIVGVALALDQLDIDQVFASPVTVGYGEIEIAHGRVSVPAPATARLLTDVPIRSGSVAAELTTPTGAAILNANCAGYGPLPDMVIKKIGYGAGSKDFPNQANVLRLVIGSDELDRKSNVEQDTVWELCTVIDDATAEEIAAGVDALREVGAIEVYCTGVQMKKGRLGTEVTALCRPTHLNDCRDKMFEMLGTIGVRFRRTDRFVLPRESLTVETPFGDIAGKCVRLPSGHRRFTAEFEAAALRAKEHHVAVRDVYLAAQHAFEQLAAAESS